jgi:hypothetical protein
MSVIQDGKGTKNLAKVDGEGRLHTESVVQTFAEKVAFDGDSYNINTGTINLTSANTSGTLYMKNTGSENIVITAFFYLLGNTNGTGDTLVRVFRNPTTGTLISGGTAITPVNRNFGSAKALSATVLKGAEGDTVTNGTVVVESLFSGQGRQTVAVGAIILVPGNTIAFTIKPPTGNTSMDVQFAMAVYRQNPNLGET